MAYFILGDIYQLQELEIWIDMWNIILSPSFRIFCCFQKCSCWSPEMLYFFSFCKLIFWRIFFLFGGYLLSQSWIWKILHMLNKDKKQFCNSMYKLNTQKYCFSAYASYSSNGNTLNPVNIGYFSHLWVIW